MIINGDSKEELKNLEPETFHSLITDPPYGLKIAEWDTLLMLPDVFLRAFRLLVPGGLGAVFCSPKKQHKVASLLEDCGFEIRDCISWVYKKGAPRNTCVSHSIDKLDAKRKRDAIALEFVRWFRDQGVSAKQLDSELPNASIHYLYEYQAQLPTYERLRVIHERLTPVHARIWELRQEYDLIESENAANRERTGKVTSGKDFKYKKTRAHSEQAKAWEGWKPNLKAAHEQIILIRKPFSKTLAENISAHSAGAFKHGDKESMNFISDHDPYFDIPKPKGKQVHPTVKPVELMAHLCSMLTVDGGRILDPFAGTGTTGVAATQLGYEFVGVEIEPRYAALAKERIEACSYAKPKG